MDKERKTLLQWLDYIECQHHLPIDLGLERVRDVAQKLGVLKLSATVITVAGTNGKGTTCQALCSILKEAGKQVGLFTSPHLLDYRERVLINQCMLTNIQHCVAFQQVECARGVMPLTYFEYSTLAALWLFQQHMLDVIVLEVGLGGRLDATNVIDAQAVIITSIALDHCQYLGNTREAIGYEKAGVFRKGIPVIYASEDPPASMLTSAKSLGVHWIQAGTAYQFQVNACQQTWSYKGEHWYLPELTKPCIPLSNEAAALALLETLFPDLPLDCIERGLQKTQLIGRLQWLMSAPRILVDVAHNPHAASYLANYLAQYHSLVKCTCILGMLADKDTHGVLHQLVSQVDNWVCIDLTSEPRGLSAQALKKHVQAFSQHEVRCAQTVAQALEEILPQVQDQDLIVVTGSFYTVAQALLWHRLKGGKF